MYSSKPLHSAGDAGEFPRRQLLLGGVATALMASLPPTLRAAAKDNGPLISKRIPSGGQRLATIGIGGNSIISMDQYETVRAVLARMHEMGGQMIDTSDNYGEGEAVIGRALAELGIREQMFVATKFDSENVTAVARQRGRIAGREALAQVYRRRGGGCF